MFKNKKSRTILITVALILTLSVTVFAKTISEQAEIFYNNIKIYIDGAEIVPKDANGNVVEPFTMNGTTYLPVRAISNAFGKDVEWDGSTQSVYIGKKDQTKPDNYLDKIQYNDYKTANDESRFSIVNGTITDYNNTTYTNGILFLKRWHGSIDGDTDEAQIIISYPLNSQYRNFKGKIVLPKQYNITTWGKNEDVQTTQTDIWIYGDNKLLYSAKSVTASMPFSFDIDTTGVNQLTVKISTQAGNDYVALTDLALYK